MLPCCPSSRNKGARDITKVIFRVSPCTTEVGSFVHHDLLMTCVMFRAMSEYFLVTSKEVKRFVTECMVAVGAAASHGGLLADTLIAADSRGHYSHGLNRLGQFYTL